MPPKTQGTPSKHSAPPKPSVLHGLSLPAENAKLEDLPAEERVAWAVEHFMGDLVLSSSFGAQAAVCLHMASTRYPDIPVILVDTGYLFPETYRFIDELTKRLNLNLKVYNPTISAA